MRFNKDIRQVGFRRGRRRNGSTRNFMPTTRKKAGEVQIALTPQFAGAVAEWLSKPHDTPAPMRKYPYDYDLRLRRVAERIMKSMKRAGRPGFKITLARPDAQLVIDHAFVSGLPAWQRKYRPGVSVEARRFAWLCLEALKRRRGNPNYGRLRKDERNAGIVKKRNTRWVRRQRMRIHGSW